MKEGLHPKAWAGVTAAFGGRARIPDGGIVLTDDDNCPADVDSMHFISDNGRIDIDGWGGTWINVFQGNQRLKYPPIPGKSQTPDENFVDAILGRAEPRTSPKNGIVQSELMDAIYESARTGKPVRPRR